MMVPPGDITTVFFIIMAIMASLFLEGVFIYNQIYSTKFSVEKCAKGYTCVSGNLISSMPPPKNCTSSFCVTKGFYGGFVNGCCIEGTGEQHMDPISVLIVVCGFAVSLVGFIFLYIKYCEWKEKRAERKGYETIV